MWIYVIAFALGAILACVLSACMLSSRISQTEEKEK